MIELALLGDIIAVTGFLLAMIITVLTPTGEDSPLSPLTKWLVFAAFGTRAYVSATKVLTYFAGPNVLEEFGDYIEVLYPVLVAMGVFSALMRQQLDDLARSSHAMAATSTMMIDMVDAAPAGILLLDGAGHITFANESARDTLDLIDDPETGGVATPGWTIRDPSGVVMDDFSYLVGDRSIAPVNLRVEWPDSDWRVDIAVSVRPLEESLGRAGGVVATFERPAVRL